MDEVKNILINVFEVMEQDKKGVELGCYTVAIVGLTIAIRRVRPFSRFRKPTDIPNHFIKERRELMGLVERVDPNGGLLMIRHKPLLAIPGLPGGQLPVKISGVNVSGLGLSWLQSVVVGNQVKFIPIAKAENCVHCQVLLPQITQKKKEQRLNIGESLVRIGFGQVTDIDRPLLKDPTYLTYYKRLQVAENYAIRKKMGLKYYIKPTKTAAAFVAKTLNNFFLYTYRHIVHIPKMPSS